MTADKSGEEDGMGPAALLAKLEAMAAAASDDGAKSKPAADPTVSACPEIALNCLTFSAGGNVYALETSVVREIVRDRPLARVPRAEAELAGVLNLRGSVLPVFDIRPMLGLAGKGGMAPPFVIVLGLDEAVLGLCVDSVHEVVGIAPGAIVPPDSRKERSGGLRRGTTEHAITVLDGAVLLRQTAGLRGRSPETG